MDTFQAIVDYIAANVPIVVIALEIILRVFPSDRVRSIFSYAGKICGLLQKFFFALNDAISEVIPDRAGPEE